MCVPERFRTREGPAGRRWILREGINLPSETESWDAWLTGKEGTVITDEGGRSPSRILNLPGVGDTVVRRYFHGGLLAGATRDLFPSLRRPRQELEVSEQLRRSGVATPEILAIYARRLFPGLYRACLLSRLVPESENLREWIRGSRRSPSERQGISAQVARAVFSLHAAGCLHRDLNLSNLLHSPSGIWLLDLDGARVKNSLKTGERGTNLLRLYRSACKESGTSEPLSPRERILFLRHYSGGDRRLFRDLAAWLRSRWAGEGIRRGLTRRRTVSP